jgi:thioredoxin-related protein/predicted DNA-binding protein YlxM (UPF0122 family)
MKTKKTILRTTILLLFNTLLLRAQDTTGIHFEQQLKGSEVLAKAKAEHKYVFVDCYATWCGPCKWMDANVYNQKAVGDVYNQQFISVRMQMDKTPADDEQTKSLYGRAETLTQDYHVSAYPTFLFFDPDGNPVHKVSGSLDVQQFIRLANDAQNPDKQYYAILKNFQPGKLDTAEEKGLVLAFANSDAAMAGKMGADYLSRIPKKALSYSDNGRIMILCQDNRQVLNIITGYLHSLNKKEFVQKDNVDFISALIQKQQVKDVVIAYVKQLSRKEIGQNENMQFMAYFNDIREVHAVAQNYINHLSEKEIFEPDMIRFLFYFTANTSDRGFEIFYKNHTRIDTVWKSKDFAQTVAQSAIYNSEIVPAFYAAKKTGETPDFDALAATITRKYNGEYAEKIMLDGKVNWYDYLVHEKKEDQYWPQFIQAQIDRLKPSLTDDASFKAHLLDVNNLCFNDIFHHSDDTAIINLAFNWMKKVVDNTHPDNPDILDTYACVLYKDGKKDEAITTEQKALDIALSRKSKGGVAEYNAKIEKMQTGGPIWLDKVFR